MFNEGEIQRCDECARFESDAAAVEHVKRELSNAESSTAALSAIAEILWPAGDADHEWDSGTLDDVAEVVRQLAQKIEAAK